MLYRILILCNIILIPFFTVTVTTTFTVKAAGEARRLRLPAAPSQTLQKEHLDSGRSKSLTGDSFHVAPLLLSADHQLKVGHLIVSGG